MPGFRTDSSARLSDRTHILKKKLAEHEYELSCEFNELDHRHQIELERLEERHSREHKELKARFGYLEDMRDIVRQVARQIDEFVPLTENLQEEVGKKSYLLEDSYELLPREVRAIRRVATPPVSPTNSDQKVRSHRARKTGRHVRMPSSSRPCHRYEQRALYRDDSRNRY